MPPNLRDFSEAWRAFNASPSILEIVEKGYKLIFESPPPLSRPDKKFETFLPPQQMSVCREEVATMLAKG